MKQHSAACLNFPHVFRSFTWFSRASNISLSMSFNCEVLKLSSSPRNSGNSKEPHRVSHRFTAVSRALVEARYRVFVRCPSEDSGMPDTELSWLICDAAFGSGCGRCSFRLNKEEKVFLGFGPLCMPDDDMAYAVLDGKMINNLNGKVKWVNGRWWCWGAPFRLRLC